MASFWKEIWAMTEWENWKMPIDFMCYACCYRVDFYILSRVSQHCATSYKYYLLLYRVSLSIACHDTEKSFNLSEITTITEKFTTCCWYWTFNHDLFFFVPGNVYANNLFSLDPLKRWSLSIMTLQVILKLVRRQERQIILLFGNEITRKWS